MTSRDFRYNDSTSNPQRARSWGMVPWGTKPSPQEQTVAPFRESPWAAAAAKIPSPGPPKETHSSATSRRPVFCREAKIGSVGRGIIWLSLMTSAETPSLARRSATAKTVPVRVPNVTKVMSRPERRLQASPSLWLAWYWFSPPRG